MMLNSIGPEYPDLGAAVAKYRKKARHGLAELLFTEREEYGAAVEKAIRAKQRSELQRVLPSHKPRCASGTDYSDGEDISSAIRRQHRAALLAYPGKVRRERPEHVWREMYEKAMSAKRKKEAA